MRAQRIAALKGFADPVDPHTMLAALPLAPVPPAILTVQACLLLFELAAVAELPVYC